MVRTYESTPDAGPLAGWFLTPDLPEQAAIRSSPGPLPWTAAMFH